MTLDLDKYTMTDGKTPLSASELNQRWYAIVRRLHTLELLSIDWSAAISEVRNYGLARINDAVQPLIDSLKTDLTNLIAQGQADLASQSAAVDAKLAEIDTRMETVEAIITAASASVTAHAARTDNPHGVTAAQAGAAPEIHASRHALTGSDTLAPVLASMPAHFSRSAPLAAKTVVNGWDRYCLIPWPAYGINIGGVGLYKTGSSERYLDDTTLWDSLVTNYTIPANRAGKDFYAYICKDGNGAPKLILSANAVAPTGYTTATSRLSGGFHCLCADVGTISGHPLSGYLAGDILPASVWDLLHRPVCSPAGMVYVAGIGKWVDIYLPSLSGGALTSVYHGSIADGASTLAYDWYMFVEYFGKIGKRMLTQAEYIAAAAGVAGWASVAGASDPIITGGHLDSNAIRIISTVGCEDLCGVSWQWIDETAGAYEVSADYLDQRTSGSWLSGYALNVPRRGLVGGDYSSGNKSGALCSRWDVWPNYCGASMTSRGLADAA